MSAFLPVLVTLFVLLVLLLGGIALSSMFARARRKRPDARGNRTAAPSVSTGPAATTAASGRTSFSESSAELPYTQRQYLLTDAERAFFTVLRAAAPEGWYVFPQVRLANLVALKPGLRNWKPHFSRVAQKCVDFVLCDADDIGPRLVVELDDASHAQPDRQARDAFVNAALQAAGLPILHVPWQRQYDATVLTRQIRAAVGLPALL